MIEINQVRDDLAFVRAAMDRNPRHATPPAIAWIWAIYTLIGYTLIDVARPASSWYFLVGGMVAAILSGLSRRWSAGQTGVVNHVMARRAMMHFLGGGSLAIVAAVALAMAIPEFRGQTVGQVVVVMFGVIYFLAGVHMDRNYLWLGPVLIAGGILVGFVPHFGWTALGAVIATGLVLPHLLAKKPPLGGTYAVL